MLNVKNKKDSIDLKRPKQQSRKLALGAVNKKFSGAFAHLLLSR